MVKVSIIVPVYNVEQYLDRCLQSIQNQTLKEIEVIVVDDGSTDHSFQIMEEYHKKDARFCIFQKKNGGLSDARNYGMKKASGEYLAFIDSDDYIEPDMFEKLYQAAKKEKAEVVECDFIWEYPQKKKTDHSIVPYSDCLFLDIRVLACNKIYLRSLIEEKNLTFLKGYRYEDVNFCYKYLPFVTKFTTVEEPFYHYIQRDSSIINTQNEKVLDILVVLNDVLDYYQKHDIYELYHFELEYIYMRYILGSSFLRAVQIPNKQLRTQVLKESYRSLNEKFPNWRKNPYLKRKGLKNRYYSMMNPFGYCLSSKIFRFIKR